MADLFDPARHLPLHDTAWSEAEARAAIAEIVADTVAAFDPERLWRSHPQDAPIPDGVGGVYIGAAGIIWALDHLKREGAADYDFDFRPALPEIARRDSVWLGQSPLGSYGSLLMGDLGPLVLAMRLVPDEATAGHVYARAGANTALPPLELMWGMPGSMLACVMMHGLTGDMRFEALYRAQAARLLETLDREDGIEAWTIELYGQRMRCPGLVHGFAGHVMAFIKGWPWLEPDTQRRVAELAMTTLAAAARRENGQANWPTNLLDPNAPLFCQICHGAPGILTGLCGAPFSTPDFERLLIEAGELVWAAGPLEKGSNFCHGTGGNAHALLRLHTRTGNTLWLDRARALAMAAIAQSRAAREEHGQGRYSLWTGDIGLAVVLWDCIRTEAAFPSLDL